HLVLSTLHTNSAPETITRLLDLGLDPVSFSDALLGVLAQRLMRTLCAACKTPYRATREEVGFLQRQYGRDYFDELALDLDAIDLHKANGCEKCGGSGYKGRTGVHELLCNSEEMRELIYRSASVSDIRERAMRDGMRTLMQDGIAKVLAGQSDFEQLKRVASA
ncbi:MAG: Flp pilus assembly complex ATPase component TadA, partial [Gammaproteobacteria bacterium]|nr:Flp pilus assembly complex ATPase component TadA [Gammaproteobacteria bacterium]